MLALKNLGNRVYIPLLTYIGLSTYVGIPIANNWQASKDPEHYLDTYLGWCMGVTSVMGKPSFTTVTNQVCNLPI